MTKRNLIATLTMFAGAFLASAASAAAGVDSANDATA